MPIEIKAAELPHSGADIIAQLIIDAGLGFDPSTSPSEWVTTVNSEASKPDNAITTFDTEGSDDGYDQHTGKQLGMEGVQLRVRATDHQTGWTKISILEATLTQGVYDGIVHLDSTQYRVHSITATTSILALGKESPTSQRHLFTVNLLADISKVVS